MKNIINIFLTVLLFSSFAGAYFESWSLTDARSQGTAFADTAERNNNLFKNPAAFRESADPGFDLTFHYRESSINIVTTGSGHLLGKLGLGGALQLQTSDGYLEMTLGVPAAFIHDKFIVSMMNKFMFYKASFDPDDSLVTADDLKKAMWGLDLGGIYMIDKTFSIGAALRNVNMPRNSTGSLEERVPMEIDIGGRINIREMLNFYLAFVYLFKNNPNNERTHLNYGIQWSLLDSLLKLRFGISHLNITDAFNIATGFSVHPGRKGVLQNMTVNGSYATVLGTSAFISHAIYAGFSFILPSREKKTVINKDGETVPATEAGDSKDK